MTQSKKQKAILYLALALIGLVLLGVSMPGLNFQPGLPIPGAEPSLQEKTALPSQAPAADFHLSALAQGIIALVFVLAVIILVAAMLKNTSIRKLGLVGIGAVILLALFSLLPRLMPADPLTFPGDTPGTPVPVESFETAPIGDPPAGILQLVLIVLLVTAGILLTWLLMKAFRREKQDNPLADEADAAIQAIADGEDLKSVIIRCYLNMETVVREERGIEREAGVTPREFEGYLAARGVPKSPIQQLTRLFETARYGNQEPGPGAEQEAVMCLSAIRAGFQAEEKGKR